MVKVKNPLMSAEARGGLGGLVYQTWRGINYVKTNTSPTGQGTAKRLAAQAQLITYSKIWQTIGDTLRAAWNQYAIDHPVTDWSSKAKRITGMNWFMLCNVTNARMGADPVTAPPIESQPNPPTGLTLSKNLSDLVVDWSGPLDAVTRIEFWSAGPQSKGRAIKIQQAKYVASEQSNSASAKTLYTDAAGGRYTVFARVDDMTEGLRSTWISATFDFVPS